VEETNQSLGLSVTEEEEGGEESRKKESRKDASKKRERRVTLTFQKKATEGQEVPGRGINRIRKLKVTMNLYPQTEKRDGTGIVKRGV